MDSRPVSAGRAEIRASLIVRNESVRLPAVLEHHRRIGVDRFFIVDNASDDDTQKLLLDQEDVHVFWTDAPFRTRKAHWRRTLLDEFFGEGWGLHLDADELFVYPGMERMDLHGFCRFLEEEGVQGIFAPLIDMYGDVSPDRAPYHPGEPLLEHYPFFDRDGYHLRFRSSRRRDKGAPAFKLSGGPRERIFFARGADPLSRWLAERFYGVRRTAPHPAVGLPGIGRVLDWLAGRALPSYSPNCGKVPLLRRSDAVPLETHCLEALHRVEPAIPLSHCWASLLHFKYMPGLREHVQEAAENKLYGRADPEYQRYAEVLRETDELVLHGPQSARFESTADLIDAGLMRQTQALQSFLESSSP